MAYVPCVCGGKSPPPLDAACFSWCHRCGSMVNYRHNTVYSFDMPLTTHRLLHLMGEVSDDFELSLRIEEWRNVVTGDCGNIDRHMERVVERMSELFTLEHCPKRLKAVWYSALTLDAEDTTTWNIAHLMSDMLAGEAYADDWGAAYAERYAIYCVQHDVVNV